MSDSPVNVREKIDRDAYDPPSGRSYPDPPVKPKILTTYAIALTDAQLATVPAVRAEYDRLKAEYERAVDAYNREQCRLLAEFRTDLFTEYGVAAGPFGEAMYGLAWERGHAAGLADIVCEFEALLPLWELYRDKIR